MEGPKGAGFLFLEPSISKGDVREFTLRAGALRVTKHSMRTGFIGGTESARGRLDEPVSYLRTLYLPEGDVREHF